MGRGRVLFPLANDLLVEPELKIFFQKIRRESWTTFVCSTGGGQCTDSAFMPFSTTSTTTTFGVYALSKGSGDASRSQQCSRRPITKDQIHPLSDWIRDSLDDVSKRRGLYMWMDGGPGVPQWIAYCPPLPPRASAGAALAGNQGACAPGFHQVRNNLGIGDSGEADELVADIDGQTPEEAVANLSGKVASSFFEPPQKTVIWPPYHNVPAGKNVPPREDPRLHHGSAFAGGPGQHPHDGSAFAGGPGVVQHPRTMGVGSSAQPPHDVASALWRTTGETSTASAASATETKLGHGVKGKGWFGAIANAAKAAAAKVGSVASAAVGKVKDWLWGKHGKKTNAPTPSPTTPETTTTTTTTTEMSPTARVGLNCAVACKEKLGRTGGCGGYKFGIHGCVYYTTGVREWSPEVQKLNSNFVRVRTSLL